jgi:hypothetical protein
MNSLFIEASAKTAVGVREAFREVVEKILDTPELWAPITPAKGKSGTGERTMPGNIDLAKTHDNQGGMCSCWDLLVMDKLTVVRGGGVGSIRGFDVFSFLSRTFVYLTVRIILPIEY